MDRADKQLVSNLRYINKGLQRENKKLRADLEAVTKKNDRLCGMIEKIRAKVKMWREWKGSVYKRPTRWATLKGIIAVLDDSKEGG